MNDPRLAYMNRPRKNSIQISRGETREHRNLKWEVCNRLLDLGLTYYVEAKLTNSKLPDVTCPSINTCFEIQKSEKDESIETKRKCYLGFKVVSIKSVEDIKEVLG